jgi:predicted Zn-dependent peptidase
LNIATETIMPNAVLTCLTTDKFKTGCMSINLLAPLHRESASLNAIIPSVLLRGSATLRDMTAISGRLDSLYGAGLSPLVRKKGEVHAVGLMADFADDAFVSSGRSVTDQMIALLSEMLLMPNTHGGLLRREYVESEKDKLKEAIAGRINDKRSYATSRLFELMCAMEAYSVDKLGDETSAENISSLPLTKHYHELVTLCPVHIFYCGSGKPEQIKRWVRSAFASMPRNNEEPEIGTDIWMQPLEENYRCFEDRLNVTQGKLSIGFRLGEAMAEPDTAAIRVFNGLFGGTVTSKLFMNVREKLSLAYYASSVVDLHKGIMAVSSGIEFDKYDAALNEIFAQLEAIRKGDFSDDELAAVKRSLAGDYRAMEDSPRALEDHYLNQMLIGPGVSPAELAVLTEEVDRNTVIEIASGVKCDAVYFLRGKDGEDEE